MSSDEEGEAAAEVKGFWTGPKADTKYPLTVLYCGECSMPLEYCEYWPATDKCKEWALKNAPDALGKLTVSEAGGGGGAKEGGGGGEGGAEEGGEGDEKGKRQTRGGKGMMRAKKKQDKGPKKLVISRSQRNKKKYVTVVTGLGTFGVDLKVAAKKFGAKFACGSSVTGDDEIVIQGDVVDDLIEFIADTFSIDEDLIEDAGDQKRA